MVNEIRRAARVFGVIPFLAIVPPDDNLDAVAWKHPRLGVDIPCLRINVRARDISLTSTQGDGSNGNDKMFFSAAFGVAVGLSSLDTVARAAFAA